MFIKVGKITHKTSKNLKGFMLLSHLGFVLLGLTKITGLSLQEYHFPGLRSSVFVCLCLALSFPDTQIYRYESKDRIFVQKMFNDDDMLQEN